ncbi:DUF2911 domain-containing protein [Mucilaginibacter paludis]|uniref:DUF2911 domain-containing protein n=1 Tax=Mucilaginibacter paludis DSM 18603 TaxID=714943 RepID=H1Y8R0_9SPHI|nr:DUF2911 domain-containing protein [Mucilaginibacter paludis]EHQ26932.1 hypothetical protein Mucpa_2821 [Mucilaginibacter paludis DSM 18603]
MKNIAYTLLSAMLFCATFSVNAQGIKMPQASSGQTIIQDLGLGKVTIAYSRPNVKGRKMLGGQEPYGKVWRTGANAATTITFTDEVTIEGNKVAPGTYGLFTIPDPKEWTIILSKTNKTWGAYTYKQEDDLLRFKVKAINTKELVETFTLQFDNVMPTSADLNLAWEHTSLTIHITTDIDARVMASIDEAMKGEKKPYFAAAQYYYSNDKDMNKALEWINEVEKASPKSPMPKLWKARILLKMGNKKEALATAQEGVSLAKESKNDEYERLNAAVASQAK